ncbi:MAG: hypothetical protein ACQEUT_15085 [Bacillota bacterium]
MRKTNVFIFIPQPPSFYSIRRTVSKDLSAQNKSVSALISPDRQMLPREKKAVFPFILLGHLTPRGWALKLDENKSVSALISPDRQMLPREKKAVFPFILLGHLTPRGWALKLDENKSVSALISTDRQMLRSWTRIT